MTAHSIHIQQQKQHLFFFGKHLGYTQAASAAPWVLLQHEQPVPGRDLPPCSEPLGTTALKGPEHPG